MRLFLKTTFSTMLCIVSMFVFTTNAFAASDSGMIVRISEIEIEPDYLQDYNQILQEEAEASVRLEPGVLAIFPMFQKEQPNQIRVLEIYASRQAYELHLKTPHFIKYKTTTLKMVKSLKLIDMQTIDPASMATIFGKMSTKL
ncbi:putative quinol monooxygenase [Rheinheimera sp. MM224]|uniref:putative quinol monooxygenase n=1 Tax=Rheinheimera sp. MM224 TaxID=3019969 RepID=UPI0021F9041C|nr:putative quinol monooxygenase [Rheinheimera sp. MM224]CAI3806287.1 hypothetical protein JAMGFMIE_04131 [Rheinheimera sp. MM224]